MTGKGHLVAPRSHRALRRGVPIVVSVLAVVAVVVTIAFIFVARDPSRASTTQPTLEPLPEPTQPLVVSPPITASAGDQVYRLDLPESTPRGLVVMFPDAGADPAILLTGDAALALQDAGWAVATSDFHGASWGSPQSSQDVMGLLEWASGYVDPTPLMLVSEGMGATTSLLAMSRSTSVGVTCWFTVDPRTDLMSLAEADPAFEEQVLSAWARTPKPAELPLAVAGSLPPEVAYRIAEVPADAPEPVRADADAVSAALQAGGRNVATVPGNGRDAALLVQTAEACTSGPEE